VLAVYEWDLVRSGGTASGGQYYEYGGYGHTKLPFHHHFLLLAISRVGLARERKFRRRLGLGDGLCTNSS